MARIVLLVDKDVSYNEMRFFIMGEFWREEFPGDLDLNELLEELKNAGNIQVSVN